MVGTSIPSLPSISFFQHLKSQSQLPIALQRSTISPAQRWMIDHSLSGVIHLFDIRRIHSDESTLSALIIQGKLSRVVPFPWTKYDWSEASDEDKGFGGCQLLIVDQMKTQKEYTVLKNDTAKAHQRNHTHSIVTPETGEGYYIKSVHEYRPDPCNQTCHGEN